MIEIIKPISPIIKIPTAETFAILRKSSLAGFFKTIHTLLHFSKKDFKLVSSFIY